LHTDKLIFEQALTAFKTRHLMKKETGKTIRELGYFASLGMSVALSIFIGLGLGLWLDKKFDTNPVLMFVGLLIGIVAGFSNIIRAGKKGKNY
jgi:ATP synthase protein I